MREENFTMNLKEIGALSRNWVASAQDRDYWGSLVTSGFYKLWSLILLERDL